MERFLFPSRTIFSSYRHGISNRSNIVMISEKNHFSCKREASMRISARWKENAPPPPPPAPFHLKISFWIILGHELKSLKNVLLLKILHSSLWWHFRFPKLISHCKCEPRRHNSQIRNFAFLSRKNSTVGCYKSADCRCGTLSWVVEPDSYLTGSIYNLKEISQYLSSLKLVVTRFFDFLKYGNHQIFLILFVWVYFKIWWVYESLQHPRWA